MTNSTRATILENAKHLYAVNGYEGFSMRTLSDKSGAKLSSIYHFFGDKDEILNELFNSVSSGLGAKRKQLPRRKSAINTLRDRIEFQFDNIEDIIFVLKYYLHFRKEFLHLDVGYISDKGYLHIKEVLDQGIKTNEFSISASDIDKESKVIAHAINGFLLEYYPEVPSKRERKQVVDSIHSFIVRGLTNKEVLMK